MVHAPHHAHAPLTDQFDDFETVGDDVSRFESAETGSSIQNRS